jgi:dCMP deaminase
MSDRPSKIEYFMLLADTVSRRADCTGRHVGAIVVREDRIISTGYNGTPIGSPNCSEGGCYRCGHGQEYGPGQGYDLCICVHAEQNAILAAARFGSSVLGGQLYSTLKPCFGCLKEAFQAGIIEIHYGDDWALPGNGSEGGLAAQYLLLQNRFAKFVCDKIE